MRSKINADELARADQLIALGIPFDQELLESKRREYKGVLLSQEPFILSRIIFDLPGERFGVAFCICIEPLERCIRLVHAVIDIPWCRNFRWLEDPWRKRPREEAYWFPAPPERGFERDMVLNHLLQRRIKLFPGDRHDGSLLGIGEGAIPEHYRDRQRLSTLLSLFDTRNGRYDLTVDLMVKRERQRRKMEINVTRGTEICSEKPQIQQGRDEESSESRPGQLATIE